MKPINPKESDPIEKEMKSLIDRLNNENAALSKILNLAGLSETDQTSELLPVNSKEKSGNKKKANNHKSQI
ncbi:MAG: hypothetical protein HGA37_08250 [Lentimicrobium sp.]|nr:hypothetical protein [Lentimicrobium sp.]